MNAATPTYDQVADGMVAQLAATLQAPGTGVTADKPLRFVKRFMGRKFTADDFGKQGGAGRTPGVFVTFESEKPIRKTIGRRRDKVEASFAAICVSDLHRNKDDRKVVLETIYSVRKQLGARRFGLSMQPLVYAGIAELIESDKLHAYAARFTTRYWVDYTKDPGPDLLLETDGEIVAPTDPSLAGAAPIAPQLAVHGVAGAANVAYELQALYGTNPRSDWSPWARITTAPNVFSAANSIIVTWAAVAGATSYRLRRRWASNGLSLGVIYTGNALTFTDDGSVAGDGNITPERGLNLDGDY